MAMMMKKKISAKGLYRASQRFSLQVKGNAD
jgi:hypothetical protein